VRSSTFAYQERQPGFQLALFGEGRNTDLPLSVLWLCHGLPRAATGVLSDRVEVADLRPIPAAIAASSGGGWPSSPSGKGAGMK